jgi:3-oxoacyl-[acyl-carrier protein] reductase
MLLKDKNAVIYGAGGAIGSAVARAFAREGANVFLTGHTMAPLELLAKEIAAAGAAAEIALIGSTNSSSGRSTSAVPWRRGSRRCQQKHRRFCAFDV